jgi:predicted TIM-barrel fold metal-dependent hydrolase
LPASAIAEAIARIPFVDHHVHQPNKGRHLLTVEDFRRPFTEAALPGVWQEHLGTLIGYRWMVRELAAVLGVAADEATVVAARNALAEAEYHRLLADRANLGPSYADDLFDLGNCFDVAEWAALLGRPVHRLLRVEIFTELGYVECPTLDEALARLSAEVAAAPERGIVGLKSIAAYRTGLAFAPPTRAVRRCAAAAYGLLRDAALRGSSGRIADKDLVDTIVWTALEAAIPLRLPMQFHVAFGDDDIVMTQNDPTLMRALFRHEPFRVLPLVLLHCYPYHRQAAYLASVYPNAYVDLGLTIPIVGPGAERVLAETLELTPTSQLLASTDGHMTPEFQWFGVHVWRWALTRVLDNYVTLDVLSEDAAIEIAGAVMRDNAERIYPLAQAR